MDYRELPAEFEKSFDAFVSIEMLEVKKFLLNGSSTTPNVLTSLLRCSLI